MSLPATIWQEGGRDEGGPIIVPGSAREEEGACSYSERKKKMFW